MGHKQGELMRFHWVDDDDEGSFFELRIRIDAMTNEVALIVTDHAWPHGSGGGHGSCGSRRSRTLMRVLGS